MTANNQPERSENVKLALAIDKLKATMRARGRSESAIEIFLKSMERAAVDFWLGANPTEAAAPASEKEI
jgi:hypothetical protein